MTGLPLLRRRSIIALPKRRRRHTRHFLKDGIEPRFGAESGLHGDAQNGIIVKLVIEEVFLYLFYPVAVDIVVKIASCFV